MQKFPFHKTLIIDTTNKLWRASLYIQCWDNNVNATAVRNHHDQRHLSTWHLTIQETNGYLNAIETNIWRCLWCPDVAVYCPCNILRSTLQGGQASNKPWIPYDHCFLCKQLQNYQPLENIKIRYLKWEIGECATILPTDILLKYFYSKVEGRQRGRNTSRAIRVPKRQHQRVTLRRQPVCPSR